jgi:hypothetical protein
MITNFSTRDSTLIFQVKVLRILRNTGNSRSSRRTNLDSKLPKHTKIENKARSFQVMNMNYMGKNQLCHCSSVTQITKDQFMVIPPFRHWKKNHIMEMLEGVILENENCVKWNEIEIELDNLDTRHLRYNPICFKLKDNLYIAGGYTYESSLYSFYKDGLVRVNSTCDRYNLVEKKYYSTTFYWPINTDNFHGPHGAVTLSKVVTNVTETLAVIIIANEVGRKMILFTEDTGFEMFTCEQLPTLSAGFVFTSEQSTL